MSALTGQSVRSLQSHAKAFMPASQAMKQRRIAKRAGIRPVKAEMDVREDDIDAQVEAFMKRQAEIEAGSAPRKAEPGKVLGADEVTEDQARQYCREIVNTLKLLKQKRDMTLNEVRLTVAIEDPRAKERRLMGMEVSSGVSRDDMANALMEVSEGRLPQDRIALRELYNEMIEWPFLDTEESGTTGVAALAPPTTVATDEASAPWRREEQIRPPVGRDPNEKPQGIEDMLPDWVGYGALYLVSAAPVLIAGGVIVVLFLNSLR